jgi:elongation factor 1-alpha
VLDNFKAERERGDTLSHNLYSFKTEQKTFHIHNVPGHRDFVRDMLRTTEIDLALLIVSAEMSRESSGESSKRVLKDHAMLARVCGARQVIVCVNKMDVESVNFSQQRFEEVQQMVSLSLSFSLALSLSFTHKRVHRRVMKKYTDVECSLPRCDSQYVCMCVSVCVL